jgi:hypothetical protein
MEETNNFLFLWSCCTYLGYHDFINTVTGRCPPGISFGDAARTPVWRDGNRHPSGISFGDAARKPAARFALTQSPRSGNPPSGLSHRQLDSPCIEQSRLEFIPLMSKNLI